MRKWLLFVVIISLVALIACSDDTATEDEVEEPEEETEETEEAEETDETSDETETEEEPQEPEFTYPLTGEEAEQEVTNRAIAVQINNHSKARPQTGLIHADMVYEFLAEGPITRLVGIFHSTIPEMVGPVRSARYYYMDTAKAHDAIYVYHGAANFIEEDLRNGYVDNLNGMYYDNDQFLFKRESFRQAPHNSYTFLENVYDMASRNNIETEREYESYGFYNESELGSISGDTANRVNVRYFSEEQVTYEYDENEGAYTRYSDGQMSRDLNTEEPIQVENILIFETGHQVIDDVGRREVDLTSGGNGYLIQQGVVKEVEWRNVDGLMKPFTDGTEAKLVPGQTWINVIPGSPGLTESVTIEE
ncbi:DUF3048 domain-containing protein [Halalkalibacillus sediminis]|uniref:DUF3048 domain-containing protein n=1 Tax=Halalkalibacillus sediminis TaxID=2018042 RepID=A0A2I0QQS3_9BACI|nr:DUF3048 domain-containing protein [Halalkalibacillus sediminis]PKR76684.1 DUF3048 domain-containing protein [Halalkalibacillus sediminis]